MSRTAVLAGAALVALVGAGATLDREQPVVPAPPDVRPTPTVTPTKTLAATPASGPATHAARAYALAASNWTARTYRAAYEQRLRLAGGPLAASLARRGPSHAQVWQLKRDGIARLGAVLRSREDLSVRGASVRLDVEELHFAIGLRARQIVAYEVRLRRLPDGWRVVRFTAIGSSR